MSGVVSRRASLDDSDPGDHRVRNLEDREGSLVIEQVEALADDHVVPGRRRGLVEALLRRAERELLQRALEPPAGLAEGACPLPLQLGLDRVERIDLLAHPNWMTRTRRFVSLEF